ncbi:ATPase, T2SS/T4P/T4SS family [Halopelagius longus]|uniref:Type II secretion protein n=1 Tax=Halopelagius longus TaxID=1236180 RepID=A0A1H1D981_9EURY|nr:ATPase, T2SS/T4P/T4SS family [Halopelagius longus]RDI71233.1 type II secretion protein [Halopelagius longus]SDQ73087.1 Type IV secretory pathway ATPase VirB11/Archaellum biosynthesis ATPase [Halopelagius longus]
MPIDFDADLNLVSAVTAGVGAVRSGTDSEDDACRCDPRFETPAGRSDRRRAELVVDADDCPGGGDLASSPDCRATVVGALATRDADVVRTVADGVGRTYEGDAAGLLLAAGRFVERVEFHDESLAARARRDPLGAAREAAGRAGAVGRIVAETGLEEGAARVDGYDDAIRPAVGPSVARSRVTLRPPAGASLLDRRELPSGATVRAYETPDGTLYHLTPVAHALDPAATATLESAYDCLARGGVEGGDRAPGRAVRRVADDSTPVETLTDVLRRYTRGNGVLDDLFADPRVTDVVASAPVEENPVRVTLDGERVRTNVRLTADGAAALASRFRRASGRAFSRATPALDASVTRPDGTKVRVAGVTAPASDGIGFAFRAHGDDAWTLPGLVAAGTLPADAAALLSLAAERGAAALVAGTRGAGKTTLLGSLLWELPDATRLVTVEDTPELPVEALREGGRDVQPLTVELDGGEGSFSPDDALKTALRLGDGALVVGEVRGEEAGTLYEAMRVGAHGNAVLGTIHGDSAAAVRERVVSDLGVAESAFGATDLVVTCARDGPRRRVAAIEEVRTGEEGVRFETLYESDADGLDATGRIERGDSALAASLAEPAETYADVLDALDERATHLGRLAETDRTRPEDVRTAYREREVN